jgi:hypothetical protein
MLTDTTGRKMVATLTRKTATAITIQTAVGTEFELALTKLSAEDQTLIGTLKNGLPVTKSNGIRVVIFGPTEKAVSKVLAKGFDVTLVGNKNEMLPAWETFFKSKKEIGDRNEFIRPFDVYWSDELGTAGVGMSVLKAAVEAKKLIVLMNFDHKRTLRYVYTSDDTKCAGKIEYKNYLISEKGIIRYGDRAFGDGYDPTIVDKVMDEIVHQLK